MVRRVYLEHKTGPVGGTGGGGFSFKYEEGHGNPTDFTIRRITVWMMWDCFRGIDVENSVGATASFGSKCGDSRGFTFENGETITHLQLWSNQRGDRCGGISFKTNTNREFEANPGTESEVRRKPMFVQDVKSGILSGIFGRSGADIDSLGFIFKEGLVITSIPWFQSSCLVRPPNADAINKRPSQNIRTTTWNFLPWPQLRRLVHVLNPRQGFTSMLQT